MRRTSSATITTRDEAEDSQADHQREEWRSEVRVLGKAGSDF